MFCPKYTICSYQLRALLILLFSTLLSLVFQPPSPVSAQDEIPRLNLPPGFTHEAVVSGLNLPTGFDIASDGRIFIAQKNGIVRVFQNGELLPEPFIDLRHEVNDSADRGLMSVALHPSFPGVPYVYLSYVYEPVEASGYFDDGARVSRVLRISADPANPNVHQPGTGVVLVGKNSTFENIGNPNETNQPPFTCQGPDGGFVQDCLPAEGTAHVIGMLRFGPDGALYVANGDGTQHVSGNGRAVDPNSLAGKILRVDPNSGQGYANNPFYDGDPNSNRSKVFAMGMRNPFRFTFSPYTGELFVADVGNDVWEEINRGGAGSNFGWPCYEGPDVAAGHEICQPLLADPSLVTTAAYTYDHSEGKGAAIGGDFYQGRSFPSQYQGAYFYGDFNKGLINYLTFSGGTEVALFGDNAAGFVQMEYQDNSFYVLYIAHGAIGRIRYAGANVPPVARFSAAPIVGQVPLTVTFDSSQSYDTNGDLFRRSWNFGDGATLSGADNTIRPVHVYEEEGQYRAELVLTDESGSISTASTTIYVGNTPPKVEILLPKPDTTYQIGDDIQFLGWASDGEDGLLSGENLSWTATLHHRDHEHYDFHESEGTSGSFTYVDHGDNSYLELCLTATDTEGLNSTSCVDLMAEEVIYTFKSVPSGIPVLYAGSAYTTPFKVRTYANAERSISVPPEPEDGAKFLIWSDGGPRRHDLSVGNEDVTLTAIYGGEGVTEEVKAAAEVEDDEIAFINDGPLTQSRGSSSSTSTTSGSSSAVSTSAVSTSAVSTSAVSTPGVSRSAPAAAAPLVGSGQILREWWISVEGTSVAEFRNHPTYPNNPDESDLLTRFEVPTGVGDDIGQRVHGYLYPPETGDYQFWIAADDAGELWLSTDEDPANARLIASAPTWTSQQEWDRHPEQTSVQIELEAGKRYYIMALQKEATGKDNMAVAWLVPGGYREVIEGQFLSPFGR